MRKPWPTLFSSQGQWTVIVIRNNNVAHAQNIPEKKYEKFDIPKTAFNGLKHMVACSWRENEENYRKQNCMQHHHNGFSQLEGNYLDKAFFDKFVI